MEITPNSVSSPSTNRAPASTTAQDDGPVNPLCEAHSNNCRTGCFVMRKIIAHLFGRNKACTSQIPDHCWVEWCRKHYQRLRHRMLEQGWIFLQINCLRTQLGRMEKWGEVQSFTIVLQRKFQEELNRNDPAQNPEDETGLDNSPGTTTKSKDDHAKEHTKASPNRFLYPYLGADKSFDDVYTVIDAVEKAANEGQLTLLPPLQFLPLIDVTLHPPPPIARPRKQRKPAVYKKQVQDNMLNDESDLETLVDSDTTKSIGSSRSRHSSSALTSSSSLNTIKNQIAAELASPPLPTTSTLVAAIPEHEIQYVVIDENGDAATLGIVPNSTNSEVASVSPLPVAQPSSNLNDTKHQVAVETDSLSGSSTTENRMDEAFEDEIHDSTVVQSKDSVALTAKPIVKNKESDIASNTLQVAQPLASQKRGLAIKKRSGATGLLSSRVSPVPAALSQKIQAPPPGSIPVIDKEYGFVGYKTTKPTSDKTAPSSSACHPPLHSTNSHTHPLVAEPTENTLIQFNSYPTDPARTYNSVLHDTNDQVEVPAPEKCKDFAIETQSKQTYSIEKHSAEIKHKDIDTSALHNGNPIASMPQMRFNGWTPINAQTTTAPHVISVYSTTNTDNDTKAQQVLTPDSGTITKSAYSKGFTSRPSPSTAEDGNSDPSCFRIPARPITHSVLEPPSRMLPFSTSKKRAGFDAEEGSLVEGQRLGKRQMKGEEMF